MKPAPNASSRLTSAEVASEFSQELDPVVDSNAELASTPAVFLMTNSFERGGSERQFVELARSLQSTRYKVHLGCLQTKGPFRAEVGEVEHFTLGGSLYRLQSMRARFHLARRLRRVGIAIAHGFDYYANLTLIPAAKLAQTPVVIGSHRQLGDLLTPMQRQAQLAMFRWSDCVICNSHAAANSLLAKGLPAERVAVIGNGLPLSAFAETKSAPLPSTGIFRVGMIARMNAASKNHRFLLEVVGRLRDRLPNFEVLLVGDGPLRAELEQHADELGVRKFVQFMGDRQDVTAILSSLDVTVLPSSSESLSNAVLESMAAGVPAIASNVGGNRELIAEDRGVLLPEGDVEAFAAALVRIAADPSLRQSMGRRARQFARENFSLEQMRKKHEALYDELLERKRWRPNR